MDIFYIGTAFVAGLVSFLAPCVLPIIPGFLAYLAGTSTEGGEPSQKDTFINSVFFVLGFSLVFALLGVLLQTILYSVGPEVQSWLSRIGGAAIIFFGLYLSGLLRVRFLEKDYKFTVKSRFKSRYLTSFVFGTAFAAGWTACAGAVLGAILGLAASAPLLAFILLFSYSLGLGVPFLLVGLFTGQATQLITRFGGSVGTVNKIFGYILIALGIIVFTESLALFGNFDFFNRLILSR